MLTQMKHPTVTVRGKVAWLPERQETTSELRDGFLAHRWSPQLLKIVS